MLTVCLFRRFSCRPSVWFDGLSVVRLFGLRVGQSSVVGCADERFHRPSLLRRVGRHGWC